MKSQLFKVTFLFILFSLCTSLSKAQDIIIKADKTKIEAKINEITDLEIKYKKWDMVDGPLYNIKKNEVFMIIYANGKQEIFTDNKLAPVVTNSNNDNLDSSDKDGMNTLLLRAGTNNDIKVLDLEFEIRFKLAKSILLGFGSNATIPFQGNSTGYYFYGTLYQGIKLEQGGHNDFFLWGNAGGAGTSYVDEYGNSYDDGFSFLWELGADIPLNKKNTFGLSVYSPKLESFWAGFYFSFL